jgi:D-galacturonate reductase
MSTSKPIDVTIIGGGMITHDQLLPSLYHLQRLGVVGEITICARHSAPLCKLAESESLGRAFPGQSFSARPVLEADPNEYQPDLFREILRAMPPRHLAVVAVPDPLHYDVIKEAIAANQHILCVKPLVLRHEQAVEIEHAALKRGLFIGVEYHKRFDRRALLARADYRAGRFGEFRVGEAKMIEPWYYRFSNFQNWFTKESTDPFTYVGCHYVDQVFFVTGLRPVDVSVIGIEGKFPNGNSGWMWTSGRVVFENGAILQVIDGLGYPDLGAGSNDQGITMYCDNGEKGGMIKHNDQFRTVSHCYAEGVGPGGKAFNYVNPDYFKMVPWESSGLKPVGYGYESVEAITRTAHRIECESAGLPEDEALERRRGMIREVDARGIIATPANSSVNELVMEAGRLSIMNEGRTARITYDNPPRVELA